MVADWSPEVAVPGHPSVGERGLERSGLHRNRPAAADGARPESVDRPTAAIAAGGVDPIEELHRIDSEAFAARWRLGRLGLAESVAATNRSIVFRVAADGNCVGFAIAGVALGAGYLQRLAVSPAAQGRGLGSDLVRASLRWARGHGARSMLVNTQVGQRRGGLHLSSPGIQ